LTPGTSGSPLFNQRGEVLAVHNAGFLGTDLNFGIRGEELTDILQAGTIEFRDFFEGVSFKLAGPVIDRGKDTRSLHEIAGR